MSTPSSLKKLSVAEQERLNLINLPESFEPTEEESNLLTMYETIKKYERQNARLKEQKAREKLAEREAEFKQKTAPKKRRNRPKAEAAAGAGAGADSQSENDDADHSEDDYDEEGDDEERKLKERREAKLEALRDEVDEARMASSDNKARDEDMLREKFLTTNEDDMELAPSLKRKKINAEGAGQSLLTTMMKTKTPPHEFSESLGIKPYKGKLLFPTSKDNATWTPPQTAANPNDGAFLVELPEFDISKAQSGIGNNTLALKFSAPADSKRFSINISGPNHNDFDSVLCHFNPRQFERGGQLVINDKQDGIWGQSISLPLSQAPLVFGQTAVSLIIQINGEGFDIFIEGKHCARLEHRKELPSKPCSLHLQFPSCDDYQSPENWIVYRAWWGNREIMHGKDLSAIAGVNAHSADHPRKLFISNLPKIKTDAEVDVRRAELERAFRKYGGDRGVTCIIPKNTTFAFVEMENERKTDMALAEMSSKYKLNRARWSRHEALQEKRAKAEEEKQGRPAEQAGW